MALFDAHFAPGTATTAPTIWLRYRMSGLDRDAKQIILTQLRSLGDWPGARMPAYYAIRDAPGAVLGAAGAVVGGPVITLIAAPGISVELHGFPDHGWLPSHAIPGVEIIRVQNPRAVPTVGARSTLSGLLGEFFVDTAPPPSVFASRRRTAAREQSAADNQSAWAKAYASVLDSRTATATELETYLYGITALFQTERVVRTRVDGTRFEVGEMPLTSSIEFRRGPSFLQVTRRPDGATFTHPHSGHALVITARADYRPLAGRPREDDKARFAYRINPPVCNPRGAMMPLVTVVKTAAVDALMVDVESGFVEGADPRREEIRRRTPFAAVYERAFEDVPPQGAPLAVVGPQAPVRRDADAQVTIAQAFIDIAVGMTPFFGDAADVAELVYAISADRDRWNRPVSTLDKAVMGVGTVLPFVGSAALRAGGRIAAAFADRGDAARRVASAVQEAHFTREEREFLEAAHGRLRHGGRLRPQDAVRAEAMLRKVPPCRA